LVSINISLSASDFGKARE